MSDPAHFVAVPGSERSVAPGAERVGPADPDETVQVTVLVRRRRDSTMAALLDQMSAEPTGKRQYLTREELAARHGADPVDLEAVTAWARRSDLAVVTTSDLERTVVLSGTAQALASAFRVELAAYRIGHHRYRGRTGPVLVPEELAEVVVGVLGLDDRPQARPHVVVGTGLDDEAVDPHASGAFTPVEVARLYQFPTTVTGAGQCIGIIELGGGYDTADLGAFFGGLGLPEPEVSAVMVDDASNSPSDPASNEDAEVALDIEVAGAVAPGAKIVVYFAPNSDKSFLHAVARAVHDTVNNPSAISISWGKCESDWSGQSMLGMALLFQDATALGVTILCASGDGGSLDGGGDGLAHVDFPASAPHALGCGGTRLVGVNAVITSEQVWSGSGGGVSDQFDPPIWQQHAGVPHSTNPDKRVGRGVPDVAGDADPNSGYTIVLGGRTVVVGGTSAVSPLWAGLVALLNQAVGHRVGLLHPIIYGGRASARGFRDISTGTNGAYSAAPGWDACTGLGSPSGQGLLGAVRPARAPAWLSLLLHEPTAVAGADLLML